MILGVISDSHDHLPRIKAAVEFFKSRGAARLVHCGDFVSPFVLKIFAEAGFEDCFGVFGNNDGEWLCMKALFGNIGKVEKPPAFISVAGRRIAVMHEPMPDDVMAALPVDLALFGHTHSPVVRAGRPLIVNPGECCGYLTGRATAATVNLENMEAELIELP
jgi:uncharacterized protein